jgi:hypothetical protein
VIKFHTHDAFVRSAQRRAAQPRAAHSVFTLPRSSRRSPAVSRCVPWATQSMATHGIGGEPPFRPRHAHGRRVRRTIPTAKSRVLVSLRFHLASPGLIAAPTKAVAQALIAVDKVEVGFWAEVRVTAYARKPHQDPRRRHIDPKPSERIRFAFSVHGTQSGYHSK